MYDLTTCTYLHTAGEWLWTHAQYRLQLYTAKSLAKSKHWFTWSRVVLRGFPFRIFGEMAYWVWEMTLDS